MCGWCEKSVSGEGGGDEERVRGEIWGDWYSKFTKNNSIVNSSIDDH